MALQYLNAIDVGLDESGSTYQHAYGARFARKLLWIWLVKVIGWEDIEKSGSYWDNPQLTGTDGATDASNVRKFTSATGGFDSTIVGSYLVVHPTAAPAATGGFSDQTRNGFYYIRSVEDGNTLYVDSYRGVHTDGLPLSETGLTFSIYRFRDVATQIPRNGDYYVVRGTGSGGDLDLYVREAAGANYNPWRFTVSPFADWVAGSPGSFSPSNRITAETNLGNSSSLDRARLMAVGDMDHFVLFFRGYDAPGTTANDEPRILYVGNIEAFHPSDDPRPSVLMVQQVHQTTFNVLEEIDSNCKMVAADNTTQLSSSVGYISYHDYDVSNALTHQIRMRSKFSGRFVQTPLIVCEEASGHAEIRGTLKNFYLGHDDGNPAKLLIYPFGTNLDKLRIGNGVIDWNGSRVLENIF